MKQNAYIFDIDGTLSDTSRRRHHLQKSPKDWKAFFADQINDVALPSAAILQGLGYLGNGIIIVTGRGEEYRDVTVSWLENHNIYYDELFMRPAKDNRDDTEIKLEIYNANIKPNYNILAVFEDRLRLVRMWREQGLFVFNCNQTDEEF